MTTTADGGPAASRARELAPAGLLVLLGVAVDQASKYAADAYLRGRGVVRVVEGFFDLRYARNPGAFFSLGADLPEAIRRGLFITLSLLATGLIVRLYLKSEPGQRALRWALGLLLAGALGNLVDRVRHGEVVDFLHVYWRGVFDWATFNVADAWIVCGVALLTLDLFRPRAMPERAAEPAAEPTTEGSP